MTEEQIRQNANDYVDANCGDGIEYAKFKAYIAGAYSRDEEIESLQKQIEELSEQLKMNAENIQKLRNPWFSVEDEKPVQDKDVIFMLPDGLVYRGFRKVIGIRDRVFLRGATKGTNCYMTSDVTHWMPIPELKKGDKQ